MIDPTNPQDETRALWLRGVDRLSVAAFFVAWGAVAWHLAMSIEPVRLATLALLSIPVALLFADLASGCVHWFADRYLDPETPVLGPMLIEPFREHHRDPTAISRHDFFEVSGNNGLVTLPIAACVLALRRAEGVSLALQGIAVLTFVFALAIFATNQLHAWAHAARPPRTVQRLQRTRLILSPEAHARHHTQGHDRAYCVTTGWLNPVLDRTRFFRRVESGLALAGWRIAAEPERKAG